jgi:MFS family permease
MHRWLLLIAVFTAAAAVLVLEIVAGRILAPYVGVSLQTFTGIIGTILAAIAVGAWAGGRLADTRDPTRLLGPALILGGILAVLSPAVVVILGPETGGDQPITIVTLAAVGFFLPAAVLSSVTPIAAKLSIASLDETGSVVGQLSAVGTAGALFGTFVTGFVLIAAIPSQPITWVVGAVLVALGAVITLPWGRSMLLTSLVVFAVALMGSAALGAPCDYETAYSCAIIVDGPNQDGVRALVLDTFVNSVIDVEDPTFLGSRYARTMDAVISSTAVDGIDMLYIGGGGYTLPRRYAATLGASATVLELDRALPQIAYDRLGLVSGDWLTTHIGDARIGIRELGDARYAVVVGDAFSGRSVPWHLTTQEFVDDVRGRLQPGGVYVMNLIDHPPLAFVRAEVATLDAVFEHVIVIAPPDYLSGIRGGNWVVAGRDDPFDVAAIAARLEDGEVVIADAEVSPWYGDAIVLTDRFAPTDQLLSRP